MQKIFALGASGSGIVAVLVIAGAFLYGTGLETSAGSMAMWAGIIIGIMLGVFGLIGVLKRLASY